MNKPDQTDQTNQIESIPFRLGDYSPNTHMIIGALMSGGDPLKMAQMIVDHQKDDA